MNQSATICAKRCSPSCVHCTEIGPCHSIPPRTPLAGDHGENTVSVVCSGVPLSSWYCSCVPCRFFPWWSSASSFSWCTDTSRSSNSSLNTWWPCIFGGGSYSLGHSTVVSQTFAVDQCVLQSTQNYSVFTFISTGIMFNLRLLCVFLPCFYCVLYTRTIVKCPSNIIFNVMHHSNLHILYCIVLYSISTCQYYSSQYPSTNTSLSIHYLWCIQNSLVQVVTRSTTNSSSALNSLIWLTIRQKSIIN